MLDFDLAPPTDTQRRELEATLDSAERRVLLEHGTEAAFCGVFLDNKREGVYTCRLCGLPLFRSRAKFDSGTGWPSFWRSISRVNVVESSDITLGMRRTAVSCKRCDAHLGHVFDDGPRPTGLRYCMNSVAMKFVKRA
jgi:peptide-methionine (R)-S-oxide reductase